ncbi:hypothetical protein SAMN05216569_1286 [Pseudoxanthomonas sp. CF125]|nr:hypothetical protein SAMN05216569_1286 [Pseudoxanthomonas sp. CF125]
MKCNECSGRHPREGGDPATLHFMKSKTKSLGSRLRGNDELKVPA